MNRLIDDLLEVTRIEAGQLRLERSRISVGDLLRECLDAEQALASSASLQLHVEVPEGLPAIWADHHRLQQVLENLVGNAVKFTPAGGRIRLGAEPRGNELVCWVADDGAGISADDLPHVFDRFWQGKVGGRRGAGLGLAISRGIIEAHGGRIWVESAPGQGSTFFFSVTLPG